MVFRSLARRLAPAFLALALLAPQGQAQTAVDLELSLLLDVSGSVSTAEWQLQRDGYVAAFNNPAIWAAIEGGTLGAIAVNFIYWGSTADFVQTIGWTIINNQATAEAFAAQILAAPRPFSSGSTAIASAINNAVPLFASNAYDGTRLVMDISGDGQDNVSGNVPLARAGAEAAGITINGISIGSATLASYYLNTVVGGPSAAGFALHASTFEDFEDAILTKLESEIIGVDPTDPTVVPEPATLVLLATGLIGMGAVQYRRRRKA